MAIHLVQKVLIKIVLQTILSKHMHFFAIYKIVQ